MKIMNPGEGSRRDTDGCSQIHKMIKTLSDLYKVQREDAHQETVQVVQEEEITEVAALQRAKSAPAARIRPDPVKRIFKIQDDLGRLKSNLKHVKRLQLDVKFRLDRQLRKLSRVIESANSHGTLRTSVVEDGLEDITKNLSGLMGEVSVLPERRRGKRDDEDWDNNGKGVVWFPSIHAEEDLKRLAFFRQVKDKFEKLSTDQQICLLSFAVFPENQEVNGTMLMYWWIGEGILPVTEAEAAAKHILDYFTEINLIEPVMDMRKLKPSTYKMNPFVHSSVVLISEEIGLFDIYQKGRKPSMNKSDLKKVCLVEDSSSQVEAKAKVMEPGDVETVFNVSEKFPDFIFKWFSSMKALRVLYLGRWERSEREIEVDSHGLMKDLSSMRKLRFLSFQGITTIRSISPSACKLVKLIILDLRGCYNLEQLPADIHNLKSLIYLDLTSCYALENIPMGLSWLPKLEVLKGFVVADEREFACKLSHLWQLPKLRKLSVRVDQKDFGLDKLLDAITDFRVLQKLKVRWGSVNHQRKKQPEIDDAKGIFLRSRTFTSRISRFRATPSLPLTLKKLDLQRFPGSELPNWLQPENLHHLEKLHLGSSRHLKRFSDIVPERPSKCSVQVLRLKFLQKLKVDWIELREIYFPKLNFLEINECPRVTLCPCDRDGIWKSDGYV
ncbi:unnamed protein product [Thlaspi arvense]|uniref:Disease resistance R13L4/SHOC-2-like LRR domain-containing protein n=1 Tax=Thlaspi arvense TaxID=13288 RepID=A0AAU9RRG9_THLAR|nr:unnamed protein product [Thlaspi arvense]